MSSGEPGKEVAVVAPEEPAALDSGETDAIVSAVNEAAKEVVDEAIPSSEGGGMKIAGSAEAAVLSEIGKLEEESKKVPKKRVRRVGKMPARKNLKIERWNATTGAPRTMEESDPIPAAALAENGIMIPQVVSKHDEKWNNMFDKLVQYKTTSGTTLVPQCYDVDPRLGRWVHYQRVEYWIYQQTGTGKITPDRISRLEALGMDWDPQKSQWTFMFKKLEQFKDEVGHCKVPKGYAKDAELANWVRNQRLEHANMSKGKKSRMTDERFKKLDDIGFKWSTSMPARGSLKPAPEAAATPQAKKNEDPKVGAASSGTPKENEDAATPVAKSIEV